MNDRSDQNEQNDLSDLRYPIGKFRQAAAYTADLRSENIATIAACPAAMRRAVDGLQAAQLDTPYRDGGWTVRQVVHHVPDSHMNAYVRHKLAVTEERPTIRPYQEAAWAELADGKSADIALSLTLLAVLHERWERFLRALPSEMFDRAFIHPAMPEPVTLDRSIAMYAWHGRHHVAQIDALRRRSGW